MKKFEKIDQSDESLDTDSVTGKDSDIAKDRREAVTKLAYASPLLVGLLFSKHAAAFSPPPPPG